MFHDEKLNKIKKESDEILPDYNKKLEEVSSDIKVLEKLLGDAGISTFRMVIEGRCFSFEVGHINYSATDYGSRKHLKNYAALERIEGAKYLPVFFQGCLEKIKELMGDKK